MRVVFVSGGMSMIDPNPNHIGTRWLISAGKSGKSSDE